MDHVKVLKRAWHILWNYRALWIFGIILALTTTSWAAERLYEYDGDRDGRRVVLELPQDMQKELDELNELLNEGIPSGVKSTIIAVGIGLACGILFLYLVTKIARYVSEAALIRMVDDSEETGEQHSVRQGLRMGWSRIAWRLFLIDLLINIPVAVAFVLLFLVALAPLLLWATKSTPAGAIGTVAAIGLFFLSIFLVIIVSAVLSLLKRFFRRACAMDELGVIESIRQGYAVVRQNLKDVGLMWLIMVGVSLGYQILIIPVVLLLVGIGAVLGGVPALMVGGLTTSLLGGATSVLLALAVGIPIFLLVLVAPLAFLGGLREVFQSSSWTLTYRELRALEDLDLVLDAPDPA